MNSKHFIMPGEDELRVISDISPVLTWVVGADNQGKFFSQSWEEFTGISGEGAEWESRIHVEDLPLLLTKMDANLPIAKEFKIKCRMWHRASEFRWLAIHGLSTFNSKGVFTGYFFSAIDISDLLSSDVRVYAQTAKEGLLREQDLNEELASTYEEISAANEELLATNDELQRSQLELSKLNSDLEKTVLNRTQSLELQQHRMRDMIETAPFPIGVYVGRGMRIEFANKSITDVWGKGEDVKGKLYTDVLPELLDTPIPSQLANVFTTGIAFHGKNQKVDLVINGELRPFYFNYSFTPLRDPDGQIYGVMNTAAEITDLVNAKLDMERSQTALIESRELVEKSFRDQQETSEELAASNEELAAVNEELTTINEDLTQAQESLFRSEKLFKSIALNIPDSLIIVIDTDQRFLTIEGDLMQKMGYNGADYVGKHPLEVSPPERYEASRVLYERVLAGERFSVERKSATGEDFMVHLVPLRDEDNEVYAGLLIALDITRIKNAELESARLAAIVHSSNDAIISKTLEGIITSWNKSAETIFGYTEAEMLGESILKLIPSDRVEEEPSIIARIKAGERVEHFETKRKRKDDTLIDVSLSISPIIDTNGTIIGVSKIARDISEKKLEDNRKNDFIGMVSHELKTPLTSLSALIQVLERKLKTSDDPFLSGATEKAAIQVRKMASMIHGFLNVSRLESGQLLIERNEFELRNLIIDVVSEAQIVSPDSNIEFLDGEKINVFADADKIASVISNLIGNAVKYSDAGAPITVKCGMKDSSFQVSVSDHGIGISEKEINRLFERYYRVATNDILHISGFGIGLYLSSEIIKRHGGQIWAESEPGQGSTFHFTVPLKQA